MSNLIELVPVAAQGVVPETVVAPPKSKSKRRIIDFWSQNRRAAKDFNCCLTEFKSNDAKLGYLRKYYSLVPDVQKLFDDFMSESKILAEKLQDRVSVVKACDEVGTTPMILATHVVFMGKTAVQKVLKYGVGEDSPIHGHLDLFKDPFMPEDAQDFVNPEWLPSKNKKVA